MRKQNEYSVMKKIFGRRNTKILKKIMAAVLTVTLVFDISSISFAANTTHTTTEKTALELTNAALSNEAAKEGMVLLENKNNALPIVKGTSVALFGGASYATMKGGTGSGDVNQRYTVSVYEGLKSVYTISSESWIKNFITNYETAKSTGKSNDYVTVIPRSFGGAASYAAKDPLLTADDITAAKTVGTTTAIYTVGRISGEGSDRSIAEGDYYLSANEKANIKLLAESFDKSIVILNVGGIMDTKFFDEIKGLDGLFLMSQAGMESGNALAQLLDGEATPSGKLTDTWAENYSDYPASATIGNNDSDPLNEIYKEGVFVGYRYFDSFGITPAYEFGYGKSYTNFSIDTLSVTADKDKVTAKVRVTNTGNTYSGKEVVQIYFSAPQGSIEKPYQELAAYAKTDVLAPAQSQDLTISFNTTDMSSYSKEKASYIMEDGDYLIRVGNSSRNSKVSAVLTIAKDVITEKLSNQFISGNTSLVETSNYGMVSYSDANEASEIATAAHINLSFLGFTPENNASEYDNEAVTTYVSTKESSITVSPAALTVTSAAITGTVVNVDKVADGTTLYDVYAGKVTIEQFVGNLSVTQLANIVNGKSGQIGTTTSTGALANSVNGAAGETTGLYFDSLGIPNIVLADGPAGVRITQSNTSGSTTYYQYCTAWPIGTALAQTWNTELIHKVGVAIGKEMVEYGVTLWLAPGMNIHRDPLCGRNFEYYSEDPFLTGSIGAATTLGVQANPGIGVTIKHYAGNNQETQRSYVNNTVSERALREIYLKGFEMVVKAAQPMAIMSSYNKNNGTYAVQDYDLLKDIARGEWGFDGMVMSDWGAGNRASVNTIFHAGNDIVMSGSTQTRLVNSLSGTPMKGTTYTDSIASLGDVQKCAITVLKTVMRSTQFAKLYAAKGVTAVPYSGKYSNLETYNTVNKDSVVTPSSYVGTSGGSSTVTTGKDEVSASTSNSSVKAEAKNVSDSSNTAVKAILKEGQTGSVVLVSTDKTKFEEAKVTVTVADATSGQNVYIYKVNEKTKKLDMIVGGYAYKADKNNAVTYSVVSEGTYVVLTSKASSGQITQLKDQVVVNASKTKISVGKTAKIKETLPAYLQKVTDLKEKTPSASIGNVKISYKSSNTKVVKISANGNISGKKAGTATITVTIKLYDGTTKVTKTKISVVK